MITVRRASESGTVGLECGKDVRCADCMTGMHGLVWYAERLVAMHHTEPVVELLCLSCARIAKEILVPKKQKDEGKHDT